MDMDCPYHFDHESRIKRLETKVEKHEERITGCEKFDAVISERIASSLEKLEELPAAINALEKSNLELSNRVNSTNSEVSGIKKDLKELKKDMKAIDDEGKFNIRQWLKRNWVSIVLGLSLLAAVGSNVVKGIIK